MSAVSKTSAAMPTCETCLFIGPLPFESCSPAAKRPSRKDAGSARSRRLRARLRTPRDGALQRPGECEAGGSGPSLPEHLSVGPVGDEEQSCQEHEVRNDAR